MYVTIGAVSHGLRTDATNLSEFVLIGNFPVKPHVKVNWFLVPGVGHVLYCPRGGNSLWAIVQGGFNTTENTVQTRRRLTLDTRQQ